MTSFTMPALGADMETGKVIAWNVQAGDTVHSGDVVAVVETHKGAIDVECFLDGVIDELAPLDTALPVGAVLAQVHAVGELHVGRVAQAAQPATAPEMKAAAPPKKPPAAPQTQTDALSQGTAVPAAAAPRALVPPPSFAPGARALVSPAARHRASELGMALAQLQGSGDQGALTLADVERAHALAAPAPPTAITPQKSTAPAAHTPPKGGFDPAQMRQAIAAAMGRSKREIPHYYLSSTLDFGAAQAWLDAWNTAHEPPQRLLPAVLLLKATVRALEQVPQLNGFYDNGVLHASTAIHVGWAVALRGGGLVAPAIHDANRKTLAELMAALRDLVQRARSGGLRSSELTDPTITVTSLGERGADSVLGVIYPPQVAIVGFGRLVRRPWVVDGQLVARALVTASLSGDHRAGDGHLGGQLLAAIDTALQAPEQL